MKRTTRCAGLASVVLCLASLSGTSGCSDPGAATQQSQDLTGGTTDGADQFPSTMLIRNNCTVSKVGPRHLLTAAHCVHDRASGGVKAGFHPEDLIEITDLRSIQADRYDSNGYRWVNIETTVIHPTWLEGLEPAGAHVLDWPHPPDVALIVLAQAAVAELADIPEATVDLTRVADGDGVWIMGYGCESGIQGQAPYPTGLKRLKVHRTVAEDMWSLDHRGMFIDTDSIGPVHAGYLITPGQTWSSSEASLCPGDSGGPVYRADGMHRTIVGVNAYYSFMPHEEDPVRISYTNWHTRLSEGEPWGIGEWLQDLGVNVE